MSLAPATRGEAFPKRFDALVRDVEVLKGRGTTSADESGTIRLGDVNLLVQPNDDGSLTVSLQNAKTNGPPVTIGVLT